MLGRLGEEPEIRYTLNGTPVAHFSIATNEVYYQDDRKEVHTEWHRIVAFGKMAEACGLYLSKGSKVFIEGKLRSRSFENRHGQIKKITEVWADRIIFLDPKPVKDDISNIPIENDMKLPESVLEEDIPF
ncbi:MAG: single-stranded DNA-binding protein [Desulfurococcaceae archaeon]